MRYGAQLMELKGEFKTFYAVTLNAINAVTR